MSTKSTARLAGVWQSQATLSARVQVSPAPPPYNATASQQMSTKPTARLAGVWQSQATLSARVQVSPAPPPYNATVSQQMSTKPTARLPGVWQGQATLSARAQVWPETSSMILALPAITHLRLGSELTNQISEKINLLFTLLPLSRPTFTLIPP